MYLFTYVKQKAPGNREVLRSVYSCGFSGQSTAVGSQVSLQLWVLRSVYNWGYHVSLQLWVLRSVYSWGYQVSLQLGLSGQYTAVGSQISLQLWVLSTELALCHPSCAYNLEVAPRIYRTFKGLSSRTLRFPFIFSAYCVIILFTPR